MAVAADWINLTLAEIGAGLDTARYKPELDFVSANAIAVFGMYNDYQFAPRLHVLFAKRHLAWIIRGQIRNKVTASVGGLNVSQDSSFRNIEAIITSVENEIKRVLAESRANRAGAVQLARATSAFGLPVGVFPGGQGDPSAPAYRGSPFQNFGEGTNG